MTERAEPSCAELSERHRIRPNRFPRHTGAPSLGEGAGPAPRGPAPREGAGPAPQGPAPREGAGPAPRGPAPQGPAPREGAGPAPRGPAPREGAGPAPRGPAPPAPLNPGGSAPGPLSTVDAHLGVWRDRRSALYGNSEQGLLPALRGARGALAGPGPGSGPGDSGPGPAGAYCGSWAEPLLARRAVCDALFPGAAAGSRLAAGGTPGPHWPRRSRRLPPWRPLAGTAPLCSPRGDSEPATGPRGSAPRGTPRNERGWSAAGRRSRSPSVALDRARGESGAPLGPLIRHLPEKDGDCPQREARPGGPQLWQPVSSVAAVLARHRLSAYCHDSGYTSMPQRLSMWASGLSSK
ncbi:uncharacterized protein LOC141727327 [Zonotrichia albicollis]|uniref:uncharacterized protein LOC141727327 n=1 Tax=Zonotrichia albicollis TaxID=44394 RepID=UPI003D810D25